MRLRVNKSISLMAMFSAVALVLSYFEAVSGINALLPIAGTKLGLANIAVTVVSFVLPLWCGLAVSIIRVSVASLLFGGITSFLFSLFGALLSFVFIAFSKCILKNKVSLIGTSVGASAFHMVGQLFAAVLVLKSTAVFNLLPLYLVVAALTGALTGMISQILYDKLRKIKYA